MLHAQRTLKLLVQRPYLRYSIALLCLVFQYSFAQFSVVGTYKVQLSGDYLSFKAPSAAWQNQTTLTGTTGMNLEFAYELNDLTLKLIMEPSAFLNNTGTGEVNTGLREAYASYRFDDVDISLGLERLPLETARLSVPFSITNALDIVNPNELKGFFDGIWSARSTWYLEDNQFRLAAFYREQQERVGGVISFKRFFENFDAQTIIVYDDYFALGLNGSTLVEDIVLYGESWFLLDAPISNSINTTNRETNFRVLLGATGYLDDGLWTIETGYMPSQFSPSSIPQLLAQYQLPQDATTWTVNTGIGYVETNGTSSIAGLISLNSNFIENDSSAGATISTVFTDSRFAISIGFNFDQAFDYFSE